MAAPVLGLGIVAAICADDGVEDRSDKSSDARQGLEIRRRFAELSRKVNELPELLALKAEVEKAQAAYSEAFEAALAKEDPEILKQYRGLFEARIVRLQEKKAQADAAVSVAAGSVQSPSEGERIAAAQKKAMLSPAVREALQKWTSATSDEERSAAKNAYLETLRRTMIEDDPSLKSLLLGSPDVTTEAPVASPESPVAK